MPKHIQKIALVTAKDSAALHDMLKIIEHRWAGIEVMIVDTLVQGKESASQIVQALRYADSIDADVVVVGRGGGSAEDLWAFNEEVVADAIFSMQTPVVSCVGHEVDVLISDFVADLRAPTPSAAMEMILPDSREILYTLDEMQERFSYVIDQRMQRSIRDLKHSEEMLLRASPLRLLGDVALEFERLKEEYKRILSYAIERFSSKLPEIQNKYVQSMVFSLEQKEQHLTYLTKKFEVSNPKLQYRKGWAQVSQNGKTMPLKSIQVKDVFTLSDGDTQKEVLCLS